MKPSSKRQLPPFQTLLLASALSLALVACGGGSNTAPTTSGNGSPVTTNPAAQQPGTPEPDPGVVLSAQTFKPNTGTVEGSSDASTAFALADGWMLVADDESNVLRVYPRTGGAAVLEWSYELNGPMFPKELDLEAGARVGDTLYLVGSHSNKKDGADAMADRSHLFAVKTTGTGAQTQFSYVGQFAQLETQLVAWDSGNLHGLGANHFGFAVSAGAGVIPEQVNGFSIEGMAAAPGDAALWLAFRAPLTDTSARNKALIVPVTNYAALVGGGATQAAFGTPIQLDLGGRGIRSIDKGTDGHYLITAGPAGASSAFVDRNFALYAWDGNPLSAPVELANDLETLRKESKGSFEAVVEVPGPVAVGTQVQLLLDNGDTVWTSGGAVSKDLPPAQQQFLGYTVRLGGPRVDKEGPVLKSSSPADDRVGVTADSPIVLSFNEGIRFGAGAVVLHKADGSVVESFNAASPAARAQVSFNELKLVPTNPLEAATDYYITVDANAVADASGNAFAGIQVASKLNFRTADGPTALVLGDVLFLAANAQAPDAFAFVLTRAVTGGTRIYFTDRDRKAATEFVGITNEAAFVWTADQDLPAGSIVTIQTDTGANPIADKGTVVGKSGGIGKEETYFAFAGGTIAGLGSNTAGEITAVSSFLASITLGGAAGDIPAELTTAGTAMSFTIAPTIQTNVIYNGSLDRSDMAAFVARVKNPANWTTDFTGGPGRTLTNGSFFPGQ